MLEFLREIGTNTPVASSALTAVTRPLLCTSCSSLGPGYPAIAVQALYHQIVWNQSVLTVRGTSSLVSVCLSLLSEPSAPRRPFSGTQPTANVQTAAGIIALINDFRIKDGAPPLGFLDPWLYEVHKSVNDITSGRNPGCNTERFSAIPGWDPVRPARLESFHFRCSLILEIIAYGSRDTEL